MAGQGTARALTLLEIRMTLDSINRWLEVIQSGHHILQLELERQFKSRPNHHQILYELAQQQLITPVVFRHLLALADDTGRVQRSSPMAFMLPKWPDGVQSTAAVTTPATPAPRTPVKGKHPGRQAQYEAASTPMDDNVRTCANTEELEHAQELMDCMEHTNSCISSRTAAGYSEAYHADVDKMLGQDSVYVEKSGCSKNQCEPNDNMSSPVKSGSPVQEIQAADSVMQLNKVMLEQNSVDNCSPIKISLLDASVGIDGQFYLAVGNSFALLIYCSRRSAFLYDSAFFQWEIAWLLRLGCHLSAIRYQLPLMLLCPASSATLGLVVFFSSALVFLILVRDVQMDTYILEEKHMAIILFRQLKLTQEADGKRVFDLITTVSIGLGTSVALHLPKELSYCLTRSEQWMHWSAILKPQFLWYNRVPPRSFSSYADLQGTLFTSGSSHLAVMFIGRCPIDIAYALYSGHGWWRHLEYATVYVFDKWPPWRRGGFSPGPSSLLFLLRILWTSDHLQLPWDPGGKRHSGLRASRTLRGRECQVRLRQRTGPGRHGPWAILAWAGIDAVEYIDQRSCTEKGPNRNEMSRLLPLVLLPSMVAALHKQMYPSVAALHKL